MDFYYLEGKNSKESFHFNLIGKSFPLKSSVIKRAPGPKGGWGISVPILITYLVWVKKGFNSPKGDQVKVNSFQNWGWQNFLIRLCFQEEGIFGD